MAAPNDFGPPAASIGRRVLRRLIQAGACAAAVAAGAAVGVATSPAEEHSAPPRLARAELTSHYGGGAPQTVGEAGTATPRPSVGSIRGPESQPPRAELEDALPVSPLRPFGERLRDGMVITGATDHRLLLFTFDDGPDPRNTPRLLDTLDRFGVKAVFFLTASRLGGDSRWQERNNEIAREIVRRGHMVANHTVDHAQLPLLSDVEVIAQVRGADEIFEEVLGERTWLVRPPGGGRSARVDAILARHGYTQVLWNLGTGDFQLREAEDVFRVFRRAIRVRERDFQERGGIVLLHDTHEWSVDAVPMILGWVRDQNCELLETDEELYDIVGDPRAFFRPRADDASAAAPPGAFDDGELESRQAALRESARRRCERLASR